MCRQGLERSMAQIPRMEEALAALRLLIAEDSVHWHDALRQSGRSFRLVGQWTGIDMLSLLEAGPGDAKPVAEAGGDRPLAALLETCGDGGDYSFTLVLKALLILSLLRMQGESGLIGVVANGAAKAARGLAGWPDLLPDRLGDRRAEGQPGAQIRVCLDHAAAIAADPRRGLNRPQRDWLANLQRWAHRLLESLETDPVRRAAAPGETVPVFLVQTMPSTEDDSPPPAGELLIEDFPDEFESQIAADLLPDSPVAAEGASGDVVPEDGEARRLLLWSVPGADSSESPESGEARRTRTGYRSALENQDLIWTNRQLSPTDHRELVEAFAEQLVGAPSEVQDAVGLLALAHVTGQLLEQVLSLARAESPNGSFLAPGVYMRFVPQERDAWGPQDALVPLLRTRGTHVPLALPKVLADWLTRRWPVEYGETLGEALALTPALAQARARTWLETLRRRRAGLQTLSRVEWWLPGALSRVSYGQCPAGDHVPPKLLCAVKDAMPEPAAYYRAYRTQGLADMYRRALSEAGWAMPAEDAASLSSETWVGSALNIETSALREMWERAFEHFSAAARNEKLPLHERHNAREAYECLVLMFQTFHRKVSDPFESLEYLDTGRRWLVIDDKSQADTRAHRLVPLTRYAACQCDEHVDHIRRLTTAIQERAPDTSRRLLLALEAPEARAAPFRFFLNEALEIVRVTPSTLAEKVAAVWLLPLNSGRHLTSTWLLDRGVDDTALSAAAGHQNLGTQALSYVSPLTAEAVFSRMTPLLDQWVEELGLKPIPSFLPQGRTKRLGRRGQSRVVPMIFGTERRAHFRAQHADQIREQVRCLVESHFGARPFSSLDQADVDSLFAQLDKLTPNERSHAGRQRREALRALVVDLVDQHELADIEVPAVHLSVLDAELVCPMNCLSAHRWLEAVRQGAEQDGNQILRAWRKAPFVPGEDFVPKLLLQLVTDCMVLDPKVWQCLLEQEGPLTPKFDEQGRAALRLGIGAQNSRIYPIPQVWAEVLLRTPARPVRKDDLSKVVALANRWAAVACSGPELGSFSELLSRVRAAYSTHVPGIVLGYADGTHGAVSVESMCLERAGGQPPRQESVAAWVSERSRRADPKQVKASEGTTPPAMDGEQEMAVETEDMTSVQLPLGASAAGGLASADRFRALMRGVMKALQRPDASSRAVAAGHQPDKQPGTLHRVSAGSRAKPPLVRARDEMSRHRDELMGSSNLPVVCAISAYWIEALLAERAQQGKDYSPKTVHNYWSSWGARVVEQFGDMDPRAMDADQLEEAYLTIIEELPEGSRMHLYPPMRNWHRYLVTAHGVIPIDWDEIRQACGSTRVNANQIYAEEYRQALLLLSSDEDAPERVRVLQSATLVLMYRFGLRIAEVHGLLSRDLQFDESTQRWQVSVRRNDWRRLKSSNARRTVPCLEELRAEEHSVLVRWKAHIDAYQSQVGLAPLFAQQQTGPASLHLFPRHIVSLRVGQALRIATGDPSVRVHHCRHSYATRILSGILAPCSERERFSEVLVGEYPPTRRSVWAVASILGHGSPLTTFQSYAHAGHIWLRPWLTQGVWRAGSPREQLLSIAWATGMKIKSAQKTLQRMGEDGAIDRCSATIERMLRHRPVESERVSRQLCLPARKRLPDGGQFLAADRLIDRARRHVGERGQSLGLLVDEQWSEVVLNQALQLAASKRAMPATVDDWWLEGRDVPYSLHEQRQIDHALEALEAVDPVRRSALLEMAARCLDPMGRMLVIEDPGQFKACGDLLQLLTEFAQNVEILVPEEQGASQAGASGDLSRLVQEVSLSAQKARFSVVRHKRVRAPQGQSHNRFKSSVRVGMRIRESNEGRVRSAKVMTRVLLSAVIADQAAMALAAAPQSSQQSGLAPAGKHCYTTANR